MGQKRKWDDSTNNAQDARRQRRGDNKRQRTADGQGLTSSTRTTNGDAHANSDSSDSDSDLEPEEAMPTGPQKITFRSVSLTINMGICYIDFSGLHEKRDLQMLLPLIKPRKLVITSGTSAETASLAEDCRVLLGEDVDDSSGGAKMVFTPRVGETVDASVDTNAWSIKLTRELVKRLAWQTVKGLGVVAVTARLGVAAPPPVEDEDDEQVKKKAKLATVAAGEGKADTSAPEIVLDVMPDSDIVGSAQTTQPIHVGDLRIADLRRLMQANGHVAEFKGEGVLLIDGVVIVRKTAGGTIDVEGAAYGGAPAGSRFDASASFFDVRRRIYEGLAVVAGG